jgi:hypothetical protein
MKDWQVLHMHKYFFILINRVLYIPDFILKLYVFVHVSYELFPLRRTNGTLSSKSNGHMISEHIPNDWYFDVRNSSHGIIFKRIIRLSTSLWSNRGSFIHFSINTKQAFISLLVGGDPQVSIAHLSRACCNDIISTVLLDQNISHWGYVLISCVHMKTI